jgi:hypothetical protein
MEIIIISVFSSVFLIQDLNISMRFKILFNLPIRNDIKLLECLPCFGFWLSVILTIGFKQTFLIPMITFLILKLYDRHN